jgi:hypothetical protein
MTEIVIEGWFGEFDLYADQYEALTADLEDSGYSVRLERPIEHKSVGHVAQEIALHVLANVDAYVESALIAAVAKHLRGKAKVGPRRGQARRVRLYGPNDEVLREVETEIDHDD